MTAEVITLLLAAVPLVVLVALLLVLNKRDGRSYKGDYNDPENFVDDRFDEYPHRTEGWGRDEDQERFGHLEP